MVLLMFSLCLGTVPLIVFVYGFVPSSTSVSILPVVIFPLLEH